VLTNKDLMKMTKLSLRGLLYRVKKAGIPEHYESGGIRVYTEGEAAIIMKHTGEKRGRKKKDGK